MSFPVVAVLGRRFYLSTSTNPNPESLFHATFLSPWPPLSLVVFFQMFQFISGHFAFSDSNPRPKANTLFSSFSVLLMTFLWSLVAQTPVLFICQCGHAFASTALERFLWPPRRRHMQPKESRTPSKSTSTPAPSETFNAAHR